MSHNKVNVTYVSRTGHYQESVVVIPHYVEQSSTPYDTITNYLVKTLKLYDPIDIIYWRYSDDSEYVVIGKKVKGNVTYLIDRRREVEEELKKDVSRLPFQRQQLKLQVQKIKRNLDEYERLTELLDKGRWKNYENWKI